MTYKDALWLISLDYQRYKKNYAGSRFTVCKIWIIERGFKFMFWLRLAAVRSPLKPFFWLIYRYYYTKYGLQIPIKTEIGGGFYIGHGMGVVINPSTKIGMNVNISQFCTIGSNKGKAATIDDGVYIGPSCCIVEDVHIGKNAIIGAGSVVTKDIPENTVAVGSPAKVIR